MRGEEHVLGDKAVLFSACERFASHQEKVVTGIVADQNTPHLGILFFKNLDITSGQAFIECFIIRIAMWG